MALNIVSQVSSLCFFLQRKSATKQHSDHDADPGALVGQQP